MGSILDITVTSCQRLLNVSSTAATLIAFSGPMQYVHVDNLGSVDLFLNVSQSCAATAATTDGYAITSCAGSNRASWEYYAPPVSTRMASADMTLGSISLQTTSTGSGGQRVSIIAMG